MATIITRGAMSAKALGFTGQTVTPVYVEDVFSTYIYTGTGANITITNNIDLSTKGGLVWLKDRSSANSHGLWDTARGAGYRLVSNATIAQDYATDYGFLSNFNTTGFSLASPTSGGSYNQSGYNYVSWTFRKQPKFFTIVTWTGNGTDNRLISHDLGTTPGMVIAKNYTTGTATDWITWHKSLGNMTNNLYLNTTLAASQDYMFSSTNLSATSTTFPVSASGGGNGPNQNGQTYIAYLFADQAGGFGSAGTDSVVACGSFNIVSGGLATVSLGWEPQYVLYKFGGTDPWFVWDTMRGFAQVTRAALYPNNSNAETASSTNSWFYPTATGFAFNDAVSSYGSGTIYYMAIRRGPMKTPTDATKVFSPNASSASVGTNITTGFPIDLQIMSQLSASGKVVNDRMRGVSSNATESGPFLNSTNTNAEGTNTAYTLGWSNTGFQNSYNWAGISSIFWNFRRAPGFFDVVCYTGNGATRNIAHNLGVAPELIITKQRSGTQFWCAMTTSLAVGTFLVLNATDKLENYGFWSSAPTSTTYNVTSEASLNANGSTYVAYLFATCPGVSKVGSYTGTGAAQNINCGFSAGARFVLIKRTDSTGDWYVYDSARGISSGNDPYLLLNSTAAQVTGTNYVDTFASGFTLTASAPAGLNANGGSYIFLAIA